MAVPTKDSALVAYGDNFDTRVTATPITFGLTAAQATAFNVKYTAFAAAYEALVAARAAGIRSMSQTSLKDQAKRELLAIARELYAFVQDNTSVSDANKDLLGVVPRDLEPTPVPAPAFAPALEVASVVGRTARVKLHDSQSTRRGMPDGVIGATVVSYVGPDNPPTAGSNWKFEGNTGKNLITVVFPDTVANGAQVWLAAFWFNAAKESGPACTPVATNLQGGAAAAA